MVQVNNDVMFDRIITASLSSTEFQAPPEIL